MIRAILILSACLVSLGTYSQSYLGKSTKEISEIAFDRYDEVEVISETPGSIKLRCDSEINEFFFVDNLCVKFKSTKSYKCNCLALDLKTYNEKLESKGNLTWVSKDNTKSYSIKLNDKDYVVSIVTNDSELAVLSH